MRRTRSTTPLTRSLVWVVGRDVRAGVAVFEVYPFRVPVCGG